MYEPCRWTLLRLAALQFIGLRFRQQPVEPRFFQQGFGYFKEPMVFRYFHLCQRQQFNLVIRQRLDVG